MDLEQIKLEMIIEFDSDELSDDFVKIIIERCLKNCCIENDFTLKEFKEIKSGKCYGQCVERKNF